MIDKIESSAQKNNNNSTISVVFSQVKKPDNKQSIYSNDQHLLNKSTETLLDSKFDHDEDLNQDAKRKLPSQETIISKTLMSFKSKSIVNSSMSMSKNSKKNQTYFDKEKHSDSERKGSFNISQNIKKHPS